MALCARCGGNHHNTQCSLPFLRTKTRQEEREAERVAFLAREARRNEKAEREEAERDAFLARQQRRIDQHEAFLAREERRNKKMERLLDNESKIRLSIAKEAEQRDIKRAEVLGSAMIDGAGIEWWKDRQSGWWWWRAAEGEWQSTGRRYTPLCTKAVEEASARRPSDASETASMLSQTSASTAASVTSRRARRTEKKLCEVKGSDLTTTVSAQEPALAPAPAPTPASKATPAPVATLAPALPDDAVSAPKVSAKPQEPTLKCVVATIREELELEDSLTMAQVIAEANRQLAMPATGVLADQARSLYRQLTSA